MSRERRTDDGTYPEVEEAQAKNRERFASAHAARHASPLPSRRIVVGDRLRIFSLHDTWEGDVLAIDPLNRSWPLRIMRVTGQGIGHQPGSIFEWGLDGDIEHADGAPVERPRFYYDTKPSVPGGDEHAFDSEEYKESVRAVVRREHEPNPGPSYNHTRGDGPFAPCPECLSLMSRDALLDLVRDLQARVDDLEQQRRESP